MSRETTDRYDPDLGHGSNDEWVPQNEAYLVLSEAERSRGFIRPVRHSYRHLRCTTTGPAITSMSNGIAETYARNPWFYGATYCTSCGRHRPVGRDGEFAWLDGSMVGT